jgi:hypothetical protein
LADVLNIEKAQQHGVAGKRASTVMARLGWIQGRPWLEGHAVRGFIYDCTARGIGAGEWDRYKDTLDSSDDDDVESDAGS